MRKKQEIINQVKNSANGEAAILYGLAAIAEVLLDIRDIIIEERDKDNQPKGPFGETE